MIQIDDTTIKCSDDLISQIIILNPTINSFDFSFYSASIIVKEGTTFVLPSGFKLKKYWFSDKITNKPQNKKDDIITVKVYYI